MSKKLFLDKKTSIFFNNERKNINPINICKCHILFHSFEMFATALSIE